MDASDQKESLNTKKTRKKTEGSLEQIFFAARWILAPFFIGLMAAVVALLIKFGKEILNLFDRLFYGSAQETVISILTLVDISLLAGLLLIIAFSGYENFVSKMGIKNHEDRPAWMGKVGFSDLKLKLIGAIVAISAIELLKAFVEIGDGGIEQDILMWKIIVHITFAVSGVLFAVTDLIVAKSKSDGTH